MSTKTIEVARDDVRPGDTVSLTRDGRTVTGPASDCPGNIHVRWWDDQAGGVCTDDGWTLVSATREVPEWQPGTSGTATVRGVEGVRVIRTENDTYPWFSPSLVKGIHIWHADDEVAAFVPDDVEALQAQLADAKRALAEILPIVQHLDDGTVYDGTVYDGTYADILRAGIERLSRDLSEAREVNASVVAERDATRRYLLEQAEGYAQDYTLPDLADHVTTVMANLRREVERLRAARTLPTREQVAEAIQGDRTRLRDYLVQFGGVPEGGILASPSVYCVQPMDAATDVLALFEQGGTAAQQQLADAWELGYEARDEWTQVGPSGVPHDPPLNPFDEKRATP